MASVEPELYYCSWGIVLTTHKSTDAIKNVFHFVEDQAENSISPLAIATELMELTPRRLGVILGDGGAVTVENFTDVLMTQKKLGEVLIEKDMVFRIQVESALVEQAHIKKTGERADSASSSICVASGKLDSLVDLVGELVTLRARLDRTAIEVRDTGLSAISEQFECLIAQLRDNTMTMHMLPIGSTFKKPRRVVGGLSTELGKETKLFAEGAVTEHVETAIEKLGDPLVHIIHNSSDHGREDPIARAEAGKQRKGIIWLSGKHSEACVLIRVSDDGKGLYRDAIRTKAIERGIISARSELGEAEIFQQIFAPGFSAAKTLTTVSGRGVGMDVVKREIDSLGGSVLLESIPGKGMTITLKISSTLAVIEELLVRIDGGYCVFPLSSVDGCIEMSIKESIERGDRRMISCRDELLPYVGLWGFFGTGGEEPGFEQIVFVAGLDARIGFVVDRVIGKNQTVIKPLGRMYRNMEGISGATILGDGKVAPILDFDRLAIASQTMSRNVRKSMEWLAS